MCFVSHQALESIKYTDTTNSDNWHIILEDDVLLPENLATKLETLLTSSIPADWDLLFLGGCNVNGKN